MFTGTYLYKIDNKGRVALPLRLKKFVSKEAENHFSLLYEIDKCIVIYPNDIWMKKIEDFSKFPEYDEEAAYVRREIAGRVFEVEMDKQSRILLPTKLMDFAGLQKDSDVLILGNINKIELWNPEEYERYKQAFQKPFGETLRRVLNNLNATS